MSTAIERARSAAPSWRSTGVRERARLLGRLRRALARERGELVAAVDAATRKPPLETLLNDLLPTLEAVRYCERHAPRILAPQKRPRPAWLFGGSRFHVEYVPRGVVLVLAPFNLPLQLALVPTVSALVAGNAVVCKISERTPKLAPLLQGLLDAAGFPPDAVQFLAGGPTLGETLVGANPDFVFATGGDAMGRRVAARAAERLLPVILELGGKDPMIVLEDAVLERAANGAVYGAFANAGQICVAAKRLYVARSLHDHFVASVVRRVAGLKAGYGSAADVGPVASERQVDHFKELLDDARKLGAHVAAGGVVEGRLVLPTVLTSVTHSMRVMREETFAPVLPIMAFDDDDEAVALANDSALGLSGSVFTRDLARGARIASRLEVGSVSVNDVLKHVGNPHLPFGGAKASGIGFYRGPEGLRAFTRPLAIMVSSSSAEREPNWFPYTSAKQRAIEAFIDLRFGGRSLLTRLRLLGSLRSMRNGGAI